MSEKPERINKCRHFNGTRQVCCEAGVNYDEVMRTTTEGRAGCMYRLPCLYDVADKYPCDRLHRLTDEEIKASEAKFGEMLANIGKVRTAIIDAIEARGLMKADVSGVIECPACNSGQVHYRRAGAYNGHVHAQCTTENCVRWME